MSRATLRTIKQNLFWAFFYNALAVPLAALAANGVTLARPLSRRFAGLRKRFGTNPENRPPLIGR